MDSVALTVPLRPSTKKMKKRKELDALAPRHAVTRRSSGKRSSQELLSDSSDDRSEYWNVSMRGRKCRGRNSKACPNILRACSAFLACVVVLVTASLIWLFIDVRQQLTVLRTELDQVIAGNEGVPDALQKCHSLSRDLRNNQTFISSQIADLRLQMNNYTTQISVIQHSLRQVQESLQAAPELTSLPKDLKALSASVAEFGSYIKDLNVTVHNVQENNGKLQDVQKVLQQNITNVANSLSKMSSNIQTPETPMTNETRLKTEKLSAAVSQLTSNLSRINETLFGSLKYALDDQTKDHNKLVSLEDSHQNVSTTLSSLQRECASRKLEQEETIHQLADQVQAVKENNTELNSKLKQLELFYNILKNSTNTILALIAQHKNQPQQQQQQQNWRPNGREGVVEQPSVVVPLIRNNVETTTNQISVMNKMSTEKVAPTRSKRLV